MSQDVAPRIAELPELVKNKIAAGEVVERPASVVKELVENALDAGATEIRIDLEEGGARLVRIVDDGCGMGPDDLRLAFHPHATSKLREVEDLDHIASLGFRGEALASIGSVARARIVSRPEGSATGHELVNEGGRLRGPTEVGAAKGTTVEVRDLFYNTPARRRFLKRTATELGRALDLLQRLALAHLGVGFVVTHDGRRVFDVEREMDLAARIRRAFGADLAEALVPVEAQDGTTFLSGYLAPPRLSRRDTTRQMWFLNGRALKDKILSRALREAYRGVLMEGRQPVAFLSLAMDPTAVDVNVHPTKSEVRFRDERRLMGFLIARLRDVVRTADMATPGERMLERLERRGEWTAPRLPDPGALGGAVHDDGELRVFEVPGREVEPDAAQPDAAPRPASAGDGWTQPEATRPRIGTVVRVSDTYLVRPVADGFEIVDQHALHERITFERLLAELREGGVEVQRLLAPELVERSREEVARIDEHRDTLARAGLHLEAFGATTVAIHGVPARMRRPDPEDLVQAVLTALASGDGPPDAATLLEDTLASRACRSSVMAGDVLSEEEIEALLQRAADLPHDQTCPHGRPTRVRFTGADLEKAFGRRP
ncbi:MAG: DNA mismatch repair endonuclease MutL [Planctomycetota bacterium]